MLISEHTSTRHLLIDSGGLKAHIKCTITVLVDGKRVGTSRRERGFGGGMAGVCTEFRGVKERGLRVFTCGAWKQSTPRQSPPPRILNEQLLVKVDIN